MTWSIFAAHVQRSRNTYLKWGKKIIYVLIFLGMLSNETLINSFEQDYFNFSEISNKLNFTNLWYLFTQVMISTVFISSFVRYANKGTGTKSIRLWIWLAKRFIDINASYLIDRPLSNAFIIGRIFPIC